MGAGYRRQGLAGRGGVWVLGPELTGRPGPTLSMTSQKCMGASPKRSFSSSTLRISLERQSLRGSVSTSFLPWSHTPTHLSGTPKHGAASLEVPRNPLPRASRQGQDTPSPGQSL